MAHRGTSSILRFSYQKTSTEILEKVDIKAEAVKKKIAEREQRIKDLRKAHSITDQDLVQIYAQMAKAQREGQSRNSYLISTAVVGAPEGMEPEERLIGAGVIANLKQESEMIETEKDDLKKLDSIKRNLRPLFQYGTETGTFYSDDYFTLTEDDLEYLGF